MNINKVVDGKRVKGFTLLELLIVITIIAILSVALIVVINPAETLKKSRDTQRISDMAALKTAIGIYTTTVSSPLMDNGSNTLCQPTTAGTWANNDQVWYDQTGMNATITFAGGTNNTNPLYVGSTTTTTGGSGWLPINFNAITGGSPISNLPLDPSNTFAPGSAPIGNTNSSVDRPNANALVYRYACFSTTLLQYEIDATLESAAYGNSATGSDNKMASDGGNSTIQYEVGTNLSILGANTTNNGTAGF